MTTAIAMIEEGIEHPHYPQTQMDDVGVVHVVYLKVIGLSGILLDSQKTKATVSRNKDMLIPPRQMKAALAVVRGNQVCGISPDSKRLSRILPTLTAPTDAGNENTMEPQPQQQSRPLRRYIAVWDNSTIKTTTNPNGEITASTADSSILFETTLISNSDAWNVSVLPHDNFELIVGLTSPLSTSGTSNTAMTIPIGVATLPINEAAALRGSSGKVVLDLPIRNISEFDNNSTNPFVKYSSIEVESNDKAKSKRNIFAVLKRRKNTTQEIKVNANLSNKAKQPCIYTVDTSAGNDAATLRVEIELHEKESNVEMGLSSSLYSDEPYTIVSDWMNKGEAESNEVVLAEELIDDLNNTAIETSTHSSSTLHRGQNNDLTHDENIQLEQFERVLSIRGAPSTFRSKFQFSPARRFRVKCNDRDTLKFDLTPVPPVVDGDLTPCKPIRPESAVYEDEYDVKTRFLDINIQRILSLKESDDHFDNEDDVPLNRNDVPFDEQSFLSRDTVAIPRRKSMPINSSDINDEPLNIKPPSLNLKPQPSIRSPIFGSFWGRGKRQSTADALSMTISVTGTESSTHSISNTESDVESPPRIGNIKKVLLPDVNNMLHSSLIEVPPTDHESVCNERTIQEKAPVVKPVSILRKTKKTVLSTSTSQGTLTTTTVESKSDALSEVSCSAETEVMKKNNKPRVDYEEHFSKIIKDLSDAKSENPDTDATESMQSSSTNTTPPPSPNSTYSTPLPSFVAEESKPVIMEEKSVSTNTEIKEVKAPRKKRTESLKTEIVRVIATDDSETTPQHRAILPKKNLLAQKIYGLIDIQPCTVKIDQFLAPDDEELLSIDESWINENSTIDTFKTQRKGTIHDDLADLGLLWGDMCRQTGFRGGNDDESLLADEGTIKEKAGTKQRWMAGLRRSRHSHRGYEYDEIDEGDHSQSSDVSGASFTDEHTLRSTTEESESGYSEVGTEVDVNDATDERHIDMEASTKPIFKKTERIVKSPLLKQLSGNASRLAQTSKCNSDDSVLESTSNVQNLSARMANWTKSSIDQKMTDTSIPTETISHVVPATAFPSNTSSLPPKAPKYAANRRAPKIAESVPVRTTTVTDGSHNGGGSNNDSATPQSYLAPKSIAQSLVDFVEYVITPSPTPSVTPVPNVPTELDTDDAASVGELTATTYERQVEVDEMRRQSKNQPLLTSSTTPFEISLDNLNVESIDEQTLPMTQDESAERTYFSEYDGTTTMSPELAAAMEAAAAKQMADIIN